MKHNTNRAFCGGGRPVRHRQLDDQAGGGGAGAAGNGPERRPGCGEDGQNGGEATKSSSPRLHVRYTPLLLRQLNAAGTGTLCGGWRGKHQYTVWWTT